MGNSHKQPPLQSANYILNYSGDVLKPANNKRILQRLGANANSFPQQGKNLVLSNFTECLNSNPKLVTAHKKEMKKFFGCAAYNCCILLIFIIKLILVSSESGVGELQLESQQKAGEQLESQLDGFIETQDLQSQQEAQQKAQGVEIVQWVIILVIVTLVSSGCMFKAVRRPQIIADEWRGQIVPQLQHKLSIWKAMYPQFTFTIIYPVEIWRRRSSDKEYIRGLWSYISLTAIWCYVRVTQGSVCTGYNEPVFATSTNDTQPVIMIQQPQIPQQQQVPQQMTLQQAVTQQSVHQPAVTQQAVPQQPVTQQSRPQQSVTQQTVHQPAVTQQPVTQQTVTQQPVTQQPVTQQTVTQQPVTQQTVTQQTVHQQSVTQQTVTQQSVHQPAVTQQSVTQQAVPQQAVAQPPVTQPAVTQQTVPQQAVTQQSVPQQAVTHQAVPQQAVTQQTVTQQSRPQQSVPQPAVTQQAVTQQPVTQPVVTQEAEAEAVPQQPPMDQQQVHHVNTVANNTT